MVREWVAGFNTVSMWVGLCVDWCFHGGGLGGFCGGGCGCCLVGLVGVGLVFFVFVFFFVLGCGGGGCDGCVEWIYYFIIADILFYYSRYLILL